MGTEPATFRTEQLIAAGMLAIGDGYRAKNSELAASGLPFARAGNIDGGFDFSGADCFPEANLRLVGEKVSREGDVVFTSKGTVGRFAFVRPETPRFVFSPQLCYWRSLDPESIHPRFLYYWMQGDEFWEQADAVKGQTDMADYVSLTDQRRMTITLPPLDEQRAIAEVLGALDDKVELNRQMNHTLEEMASALFKSWFVDFDPVVAKADGRKPFGMDAATAALFPSAFENGVPAGWRWSTIGAEVSVVGGSTPSTANPAFWDGMHCWCTPRDMSKLVDPVVLDTERRITDAGVASISSGLLPAGTVLLSSRAPIGYTAIAAVPLAINQGFIAMRCDKALPNHFVLWWVRANMDEVESRAGGTTFAEISKGAFRPIPVLVPTPQALRAFVAQVAPWHDLVVHNLRESRTLTALRDTLLPKLLSGEVRLKQAERLVEAVL